MIDPAVGAAGDPDGPRPTLPAVGAARHTGKARLGRTLRLGHGMVISLGALDHAVETVGSHIRSAKVVLSAWAPS